MSPKPLALLGLLALTACLKAPPPQLASAPAFTLPDLGGGSLAMRALKGRVVVLDFWATWCGPCLEEIPHYAAFWRKNQPRGVEVVGVVFESGEPQDIADFVREHRIPYRQLVGNDQVLDAFGANQGFPTTFVIDREGVIRAKFVGATPAKFDKLQKAVDGALGPDGEKGE